MLTSRTATAASNRLRRAVAWQRRPTILRPNNNVRLSVLPLMALGGLALTKKSTTWCASLQQQQQQPSFALLTSPSSGNGTHNVVDLILPSLQALMRVFRLIQTTGLIVVDYEWFKWQQKAEKLFEKYTSSSDKSSFTSNLSPEDLSRMTTSQQQNYWEQEVHKRHEAFEAAQVAYATPSSARDDRGNEKDDDEGVPPNMTYEEYKRQQKEIMKDAAAAWVEAEDELQRLGGSHKSRVHAHAAERLVKLCRTNAGVYIKIGQHLANLDYLIPQEYIDVLSCLLDDAPTSSYESICQVIQEELGASPQQLFDGFEQEPIASASLAQVHVAYEKNTGRKLAIKVQHRGLRETCRGDLLALTSVVHALEFFFKDFNFGWIADEIAPNLPMELDFTKEGRNAERASSYLAKRQSQAHDVVIPKVIWDHTSNRVLCMEFEEGFRATDLDAIRKAGMHPRDVAKLISRVFHSQTFLDAWVHCDPHPANVLLRKSAETGKPQMVLVDHGLYKQLDDDFRITYAQLWKALMMADIPTIRDSCRKLGVDGKLYTLLSGLLTARPFDEVVERSKTGSFELSAKAKGEGNPQDKAVIRGYAQKFLVDILTMIDSLPRQMVLLLKMNDCLRHIDYALGSPANNLVCAGRVAAQAVYEHQITASANKNLTLWKRFSAWIDYMIVLWRIQLYDIGSNWMHSQQLQMQLLDHEKK